MLPRVLEPEVMDTPEEAADYDTMDHSEVNRLFVDDFLGALDSSRRPHRPQSVNPSVLQSDNARAPLEILDAGTGTAQIPIELCRRFEACFVTAVDLAAEMLKIAGRNVEAAGMSERIRLELVDAKWLPYDDGRFDAVISNSIVHHIPEPRHVVTEIVRVVRPGGVLFVRDLLRPSDTETLDRLVVTYAGEANAHQQQMFRDSLRAALTLEEIRGLLADLGLSTDSAAQTSDRHWTVCCMKPLP